MANFNKDKFEEIENLNSHTSKYFKSDYDIDFEEFDQEMKSYVAQLVNLLQTVIAKCKNVASLFL